MFIKEIVPLNFSKKKNRFKVRLEGGTDFILYQKEIDRFGLCEGEAILPEIYEEILNDIFIPRAKSRALHLLSKKDYAKGALVSKLKESGYPIEAIDAAIEYVSDYNYINDVRFVTNYIRYKRTSRSKRRIINDLISKGIDKNTINEVIILMENESDEPVFDEISIIKDFVEKKLDGDSDEKIRKKVYDHLLRDGFSCTDILSVMKLNY